MQSGRQWEGKTAELSVVCLLSPSTRPDRHRQPTAIPSTGQPPTASNGPWTMDHGPTMGFTHNTAILPCARRVELRWSLTQPRHHVGSFLGTHMRFVPWWLASHGLSLLLFVASRKKYEGITETAILRVEDMLACPGPFQFSRNMRCRSVWQYRRGFVLLQKTPPSFSFVTQDLLSHITSPINPDFDITYAAGKLRLTESSSRYCSSLQMQWRR